MNGIRYAFYMMAFNIVLHVLKFMTMCVLFVVVIIASELNSSSGLRFHAIFSAFSNSYKYF